MPPKRKAPPRVDSIDPLDPLGKGPRARKATRRAAGLEDSRGSAGVVADADDLEDSRGSAGVVADGDDLEDYRGSAGVVADADDLEDSRGSADVGADADDIAEYDADDLTEDDADDPTEDDAEDDDNDAEDDDNDAADLTEDDDNDAAEEESEGDDVIDSIKDIARLTGAERAAALASRWDASTNHMKAKVRGLCNDGTYKRRDLELTEGADLHHEVWLYMALFDHHLGERKTAKTKVSMGRLLEDARKTKSLPMSITGVNEDAGERAGQAKRGRKATPAKLPYNHNTLKHFATIPHFEGTTTIKGKARPGEKGSQFLGFRIPVPRKFIQTLRESDALLPRKAAVSGRRGNFTKRHYALWAEYANHPFLSGELLHDKQGGLDWLEANQPLFEYLSNALRHLDAASYERMSHHPWLDKATGKAHHLGQKGVTVDIGRKLAKLAGLWCGCAINQQQCDAGNPHRDYGDVKLGYNCVVPYGDWTGGDLVLWELRKRVEIQEGYAVFFRGSIITHNVVEITSGKRSGVDLFTHQNVLDRDAALIRPRRKVVVPGGSGSTGSGSTSGLTNGGQAGIQRVGKRSGRGYVARLAARLQSDAAGVTPAVPRARASTGKVGVGWGRRERARRRKQGADVHGGARTTA